MKKILASLLPNVAIMNTKLKKNFFKGKNKGRKEEKKNKYFHIELEKSETWLITGKGIEWAGAENNSLLEIIIMVTIWPLPKTQINILVTEIWKIMKIEYVSIG